MGNLKGKVVRTKIPIYAGRQKHQRANLTKLPVGTQGVVKNHGFTTDNIEVCLVKFVIDGHNFFANVAPAVLEL
jgi:hypothetical protein